MGAAVKYAVLIGLFAVALGGAYLLGRSHAEVRIVKETVNSDYCPVWPTAGQAVAAELEKASCSEFPNTWEWIGRLNKLRQELELCHK